MSNIYLHKNIPLRAILEQLFSSTSYNIFTICNDRPSDEMRHIFEALSFRNAASPLRVIIERCNDRAINQLAEGLSVLCGFTHIALEIKCPMFEKQLSILFAALPVTLIRLEIKIKDDIFRVHSLTTDQLLLEQAFSQLLHIKNLQEVTLEFSKSALQPLLQKIICILPITVHSIHLPNLFWDLSQLELNHKNALNVIKNLPRLIKTLDFSKNDFRVLPLDLIKNLFNNLPLTVENLKLSQLSNSSLPYALIKTDVTSVWKGIFDCLENKNILSLDVSNNNIFSLNAREAIIKAVPKSLTSLNLSRNALFSQSFDPNLLSFNSQRLKEVILKDNSCFEYGRGENLFENIIKLLTHWNNRNVSILDLSEHQFFSGSGLSVIKNRDIARYDRVFGENSKDFRSMLASVPSTIHTLRLRDCGLDEFLEYEKGQELGEILNTAARGLYIDLTYNNLRHDATLTRSDSLLHRYLPNFDRCNSAVGIALLSFLSLHKQRPGFLSISVTHHILSFLVPKQFQNTPIYLIGEERYLNQRSKRHTEPRLNALYCYMEKRISERGAYHFCSEQIKQKNASYKVAAAFKLYHCIANSLTLPFSEVEVAALSEGRLGQLIEAHAIPLPTAVTGRKIVNFNDCFCASKGKLLSVYYNFFNDQLRIPIDSMDSYTEQELLLDEKRSAATSCVVQ